MKVSQFESGNRFHFQKIPRLEGWQGLCAPFTFVVDHRMVELDFNFELSERAGKLRNPCWFTLNNSGVWAARI
jgi:hypothetical protein